MEIVTENLGKRFNREWIFRNFSQTFTKNKSYAITGANGSGKSTLLQILAGIIPPSAGDSYYKETEKVTSDQIYYLISITSPFQELIEEFTLNEFLSFHLQFKSFKEDIDPAYFAERLNLSTSLDKEIRHFSSGMKQKVKLGLSLFANTPVVLLDEPTSNLDSKAIKWYLEEIDAIKHQVLLIICSNQEYEYTFCETIIHMEDFK